MDTTLEFIALLPAGTDVRLALSHPDHVFPDKSVTHRNGLLLVSTPGEGEIIRITEVDTQFQGLTLEIKAVCADIEKLEHLRFWISNLCRTVLKSEQLYLLHDGITAHYAGLIYPQIHRIENRLRRFLIRFFLHVVGSHWLQSTAAPTVYTKAMVRREKGYDKWTKLLNHELSFIDFHELGDLITKQSTGFNDPTLLRSRILEIDSMDELASLKADMESNYTKYFQDTFQSKRFHSHWSDLSHVRVRVAHNGLLMQADLRQTESHIAAVDAILDVAESRITMIQLSERDQDHFTPLHESESVAEETDPTEDDYSDLLPKLTVLGKIDLGKVRREKPVRRTSDTHPAEETEEPRLLIEAYEFLDALDDYRTNPHFDMSRYLALSTILNMLEDEGYDRDSCRRMAYQLHNEGKIEVYEYSEPFWMKSIKAIRVV